MGEGSKAKGLSVMAALAVLCAVPSARAIDTPREMRERAFAAMAQGAYEAAADDFARLAGLLGESDTPAVVASMESVYYSLGLCRFFIGQFDAAEEAFRTFLSRYRASGRAHEVALYLADSLRFRGRTEEALASYNGLLRRYSYSPTQRADIYSAIARCHLARDRWTEAIPPLQDVYRMSYDALRRNWAATLLATAYLKQLDLDRIYPLMSYLLRPGSLASRSVAFNMAALEAGDRLFGDERFREALWVYRLVTPYEQVRDGSAAYLETLRGQAERLRDNPGAGGARALIRVQEAMGELEAEIQALGDLDNYDLDLHDRVARGYMEFQRFREARERFLYLRELAEGDLAEEALYLAFQCSAQVPPVERALEIGRRYMARHPAGTWYDTLTLTMAQLFRLDYETAGATFARVVEAYPDSSYAEDAAYRVAVCAYGLDRFEEADRLLAAFLRAHPQSRLAGEARMMRGDCGGALGRGESAVGFYQAAMTDTNLNAELYNHCAFQAGRILNDRGEYEALRGHFVAYIEAAREGANIPLAVYWVGVALWDGGDQEGALRYYREAVARFGDDRAAVGVDMILDEWVGRARRAEAAVRARAWNDLRAALAEAIRDKRPTLSLRLQRALLQDEDLKPSVRRTIEDRLMSRTSTAAASPGVLQAALDLAVERGRPDAAQRAAAELVSAFPETDYALGARLVLAREAARLAEETGDYGRREALYSEAVAHLDVVRRQHASSGEAAEALMLLGGIRLARREYSAADTAFKDVLGVRAWRAFWPEALYRRGEGAFAQRRFATAAAYYERIYVLYAHAADWTAKAYLRRAQCLERLHEPAKAREVLQELLAQPHLQERPEAAEAREMLARMGGAA